VLRGTVTSTLILWVIIDICVLHSFPRTLAHVPAPVHDHVSAATGAVSQLPLQSAAAKLPDSVASQVREGVHAYRVPLVAVALEFDSRTTAVVAIAMVEAAMASVSALFRFAAAPHLATRPWAGPVSSRRCDSSVKRGILAAKG
jgi:hypothetical protein